MENLKNLLGSAYHEGITVEEINTFLSGKNYVNLKDGGYVDKNKYDTLKTNYDNLKESTKDYETIKNEHKTLTEEKTRSTYLAKIKEAGIDDKFAKFVLSEIEQNDKFDDNLKAYIKNNPQYNATKEPKKVINSNVNVNDGSQEEKNVNQQMNDIFRGFRN